MEARFVRWPQQILFHNFIIFNNIDYPSIIQNLFCLVCLNFPSLYEKATWPAFSILLYYDGGCV